jgi:hypothetical protein
MAQAADHDHGRCCGAFWVTATATSTNRKLAHYHLAERMVALCPERHGPREAARVTRRREAGAYPQPVLLPQLEHV